MTSPTATAEIERLAREATAGPWQAEPAGGRGAWIKGVVGEWTAMSCGDTDKSAAANAAYIAAVSPDVVLALIADWRDEGRRADSLLETLDKSQAERERLLAALRAAEAERDRARLDFAAAMRESLTAVAEMRTRAEKAETELKSAKRKVPLCWGCEGNPSGENDPCEVCGLSSREVARATLQSTSAKEGE